MVQQGRKEPIQTTNVDRLSEEWLTHDGQMHCDKQGF